MSKIRLRKPRPGSYCARRWSPYEPHDHAPDPAPEERPDAPAQPAREPERLAPGIGGTRIAVRSEEPFAVRVGCDLLLGQAGKLD